MLDEKACLAVFEVKPTSNSFIHAYALVPSYVGTIRSNPCPKCHNTICSGVLRENNLYSN